MPTLLYPIIVVFCLALFPTVPARAFTFENSDGTAGSSQGFVDLDTKAVTDPGRSEAPFNQNGEIRQGNFYLKFGDPRSFNQRYNPDRMFDAIERPAGER
ncbi:MAG: hypothetical protein IRY89_04370 [Pseudolabrys sp.]|nr:hypothetical protein [Pseudolabrys sp.]